MSDGMRASLVASLSETLRSNTNRLWDQVERLTESPIETALLVAIMTVARQFEVSVKIVSSDEDEGREYAEKAIVVRPQAVLGKYRADFRLSSNRDGSLHTILVECDGHDFHERTKEQAAKDKERDRYLMAAGTPVYRYTGSEIYRDAARLAYDVIFNVWNVPHRERG